MEKIKQDRHMSSTDNAELNPSLNSLSHSQKEAWCLGATWFDADKFDNRCWNGRDWLWAMRNLFSVRKHQAPEIVVKTRESLTNGTKARTRRWCCISGGIRRKSSTISTCQVDRLTQMSISTTNMFEASAYRGYSLRKYCKPSTPN